MRFIAHRGNINGPNLKLENTKKHIMTAIHQGYDVEIDLWYLNDSFYLGHDKPNKRIDLQFIFNDNLWCHAKNIDALRMLLKFYRHVFYHQNDDFTLTSKSIIWTFPEKNLTDLSICNIHEKKIKKEYKKCYGICSDYIKYFKEKING